MVLHVNNMQPDFFKKNAPNLQKALKALEGDLSNLSKETVLEQLGYIHDFVIKHKHTFTGPEKLVEHIACIVDPYISDRRPEKDVKEVLENLFLIQDALLQKESFTGNAAKKQFAVLQNLLRSKFKFLLSYSQQLAQRITNKLRASVDNDAPVARDTKRVIFISEKHIKDPEVFEAVKIIFFEDSQSSELCFDPETLKDLCQKYPTIKSIDIIGHAPNVSVSMRAGFASAESVVSREADITLGSFKDSKVQVATKIAQLISDSCLAKVQEIRIVSCGAGILDGNIEISSIATTEFSSIENVFSETSVAGMIWAQISRARKDSATQLNLRAPPYVISPVPAIDGKPACFVASEPGEFIWSDGRFNGLPKRPVTLMWAVQMNHDDGTGLADPLAADAAQRSTLTSSGVACRV